MISSEVELRESERGAFGQDSGHPAHENVLDIGIGKKILVDFRDERHSVRLGKVSEGYGRQCCFSVWSDDPQCLREM